MKITNYPVGDFLIRVKNATLAHISEVVVPKTRQIVSVAKTLEKMGYLSEVKVDKDTLIARNTFRHKQPVLSDLKLISKPGLRIYMGISELRNKKGPSVFIISTSRGIIDSKEAIKKGLGGEVVAEVW